jgi:hypothetical protein
MNFTVVIPALARDVLGTDASAYGIPDEPHRASAR